MPSPLVVGVGVGEGNATYVTQPSLGVGLTFLAATFGGLLQTVTPSPLAVSVSEPAATLSISNTLTPAPLGVSLSFTSTTITGAYTGVTTPLGVSVTPVAGSVSTAGTVSATPLAIGATPVVGTVTGTLTLAVSPLGVSLTSPTANIIADGAILASVLPISVGVGTGIQVIHHPEVPAVILTFPSAYVFYGITPMPLVVSVTPGEDIHVIFVPDPTTISVQLITPIAYAAGAPQTINTSPLDVTVSPVTGTTSNVLVKYAIPLTIDATLVAGGANIGGIPVGALLVASVIPVPALQVKRNVTAGILQVSSTLNTGSVYFQLQTATPTVKGVSVTFNAPLVVQTTLDRRGLLSYLALEVPIEVPTATEITNLSLTGGVNVE